MFNYFVKFYFSKQLCNKDYCCKCKSESEVGRQYYEKNVMCFNVKHILKIKYECCNYVNVTLSLLALLAVYKVCNS